LILIFSIPLIAQEETPQEPKQKPKKEIDEKAEGILREQIEILKRIFDSIPPVPPLAVSGKAQLILIDKNIDTEVHPEVFHFETEEVSATLSIGGRVEGKGFLAGTDTSAEFRVKVSNVSSETPRAYSVFGSGLSDDGSNLKISALGGMVDAAVYPFKVTATTVGEPVKVENAGIKVGLNVGDFALEGVANNTKTPEGNFQYAFSGNFSYSATDALSLRGGLIVAQDKPVGNLKSSLKVGYGAELKLGSEEGFKGRVSAAMKAFPINDPNAPDATASSAMPPAELRGIRIDAPLSYKFDELTVRGSFSFIQYQWHEETFPKRGEEIGHELRISLGETLDIPENGTVSHLDLFVIFPHHKISDGLTTVDPGDKVDDVHGAEAGESRSDQPAAVIVKIVSKLEAKISDVVTITPILTLIHDPNYSEVYKSRRTIVGYEVRVEASF
jgi:hypothetical protein